MMMLFGALVAVCLLAMQLGHLGALTAVLWGVPLGLALGKQRRIRTALTLIAGLVATALCYGYLASKVDEIRLLAAGAAAGALCLIVGYRLGLKRAAPLPTPPPAESSASSNNRDLMLALALNSPGFLALALVDWSDRANSEAPAWLLLFVIPLALAGWLAALALTVRKTALYARSAENRRTYSTLLACWLMLLPFATTMAMLAAMILG